MMAQQWLIEIAENNKNVLKMKQKQISEMVLSFEKGFGSSNSSWRAFIKQSRGDYAIISRGE